MLHKSQVSWSICMLHKFDNHCCAAFEFIQNLLKVHPDAEIDEWIPIFARNFSIPWCKLACWHYLKSQIF